MDNKQIKEIIMAINNSLGSIEVKADAVFIMAECRNALAQLAHMFEAKVVDENKGGETNGN